MLLGSDNWPVEVAPNPDKQLSLPVHQIALVVNGVHLLENLKLDELAAKGVSRVRVHHAAVEDRGWYRVHRGAGRGAVIDVAATGRTRGASADVAHRCVLLRGRNQCGGGGARFRSPA
mgnify:CR=1 FL=1